MTAQLRPAIEPDIEAIVAMTRRCRMQLAGWAPVFFRPAANVDARHAMWLAHMVRSAEFDTRVAIHAGIPVAFGVVLRQREQWWLDDLCVADDRHWQNAGRALVESVVERPLVTCVSVKDQQRIDVLSSLSWRSVSGTWSRLLTGIEAAAVTEATPLEAAPAARGPVHTFDGGALSADAPGALSFQTKDGYVIGSPSAVPPTYDPGGPSCVIDRIVGHDREELLCTAMALASTRGDSQLIVVADNDDHELIEVLRRRQFEQQVAIMGPSQHS